MLSYATISRRSQYARITIPTGPRPPLKTDPPIHYFNDALRAIIAIITELLVRSKPAYTYDAGPNAVVNAPKENVKENVEVLLRYFPQSEPFPGLFRL
jgi:diphosphomevalonate decarboxylase